MNLSKKEEKELLKVYETWWQSYLNGDIETYNHYLDDDFRFVGSTEGEEFLDRKDTTIFFEATADQFAGKSKLENVIRSIETLEGMILITDLADVYILDKTEWVYYSRFRFSSLLRHTKNGWRFVYQHFSTPDLMANEGETLGIDKITAENLELRSAIKRRTTELELKNRELQIESALEKVRSRTMAMQKSEELKEVIKIVYQQLTHLKINLKHSGFVVDYTPKGDWNFWIADEQDIPSQITTPYFESVWANQFNEAKEKGRNFFTTNLNFEEKNKFYKELLSYVPDLPKAAKDFYLSCPGLAASTVLLDTIGLYIENFEGIPYTNEENDILMRFGKVFQQTYTRFLDLQKAEAQAREAQIEAALEKVRSRSLAMQTSNELQDVVQVVAEKIQELNVVVDSTGVIICTYPEDTKDVIHWTYTQDEERSQSYYMPYFEHPIWDEAWESKNSGIDYFSKTYPKGVKNKFLRTIFKRPDCDYSSLPEDYKKWQLASPVYNLSFAWGKNSAILVPNNDGIEPNEEQKNILKRFSKVFEQTYTRFLDLKKAEAQGRESEIELALERVRARTMAMQHSDELTEASFLLDSQVRGLGIKTWGCAFNIYGKSESTEWFGNEAGVLPTYTVPRKGIFKKYYDYGQKGEEFIIEEFKGKACKDHYEFMSTLPVIGDVLKDLKERNGAYPTYQIDHVVYYKYGYLLFVTIEHVPEAYDIFRRFTKVFEQTYTRFLDLQKAEAQAREAQIETALEKVRGRTMAMQKGEELQDVVVLLYKELIALGVTNFASCGYVEINEKTSRQLTWVTNPGGDSLGLFYLPLTGDAVFDERYKAWKRQQIVFHQTVGGKKRLEHLEYAITTFQSKEAEEMVLNQFPDPTVFYCFNFSHGYLHLVGGSQLNKEEEALLARFTRVFEQTYARFLDLKKAEAQAREAQIEMALEKVRSRTMAMQQSDELPEAANNLFLQVQDLGIPAWSAGYCIWDEDKKNATANMSSEGVIQKPFILPNVGVGYNFQKPLETGESFHVGELGGKTIVKHYEFMRTLPVFGEVIDGIIEAGFPLPTFQIFHIVYFTHGYLMFITYEAVPNEWDIFKRFGKVFEQTYTRFLDLKKAEAQAREAQIEAALERVRSRTMGMQKSEELREAALLLFQQVDELGIKSFACGFNIWNDDKKFATAWMASEDRLQPPFQTNSSEDVYLPIYQADQRGESLFIIEQGGKELEEHYEYLTKIPEIKDLAKAGLTFPIFQIIHCAYFSKGYLMFITYEPVREGHEIFKRFAKVFEQTYTRFLDLKKAENQSKEAKIELALERVRASSMAMHKSEQLAETAEVLFEQFDLLGIIPDRMSIATFNQKKRIFDMWSTDQSGIFVNHGHDFSIDEPTVMAKAYKAWKEGKETLIVHLKGKKLQDWVRFVKEETGMELDESEFKGRRVHHIAFFSQGFLILSSHLSVGDEMMQLLQRFAKVFQQTYTRFLDLQKAETNTREAFKNASVDRVRAEIASMRTATDLKRITPLVWNELKTLNVPFIRCGVFIIDEAQQQVQTHLSTPDGKAIASFNLPFDNTEPLTQLLPHWRKKELYTDYWNESAFIESTKILMERGAITSSETYVTENQPTNLHLQFLPFLQGMLYVGSEVSLTEDELNLVQNLADAFSTAYSRYEDFNRLELANKKIEKTLVDLKQTQTQLVQSEKMASLGELTAGIAHEIQNPLNFVNNFSEVSQELMQEMHDELKKGDLDEALEIGTDIEQNLEKITHHGKRASEIVKGMLQHSRSSSGVKELTDINSLSDEYLRLAYHGLRAKDKSFNAKLETEFDERIEKIDIIPQDIGRVILNLITNAFYAVNERKNEQGSDYEPKVVVHTKKVKEGIEISVKDNGNGIPKKVLDKVFQPFFTTKPSGQGTGLGLSLSYDIIKAHGGELKVTTEENMGTQFKIMLPV